MPSPNSMPGNSDGSNNTSNHFDTFPDGFLDTPEANEQEKKERNRKLGGIALKKYEIKNPLLQNRQNAQNLMSQNLGYQYEEAKEAGANREERLNILREQMNSIQATIATIREQLSLAEAALAELEGNFGANMPAGNAAEQTPGNAEEPVQDLKVGFDSPAGATVEAEPIRDLKVGFDSAENQGAAEQAQSNPAETHEASNNKAYKQYKTPDGHVERIFDDGTVISMPYNPDARTVEEAGQQDDASAELPDGVVGVDPADVERLNKEGQVAEKMKGGRIKKWVMEHFAKVLLVITTLGAGLGLLSMNRNNADPAAQNPAEKIVEVTEVNAQDTGEQAQNPSSGIETYEAVAENQIFDGYNEPGQFNSPEKAHPWDFTNARIVESEFQAYGEEEGNKKAIEKTYQCQSEAAAAYWALMPDAETPEMFRGLSATEIEKKLESLSPEENERLADQFANSLDRAVATKTTLNGNYQSFFAQPTHAGESNMENNEVRQNPINLQNEEATIYTWYNEQNEEIGSMMILTGRCLQPVTTVGAPVFEGIPAITPTGYVIQDAPGSYEAPTPITDDGTPQQPGGGPEIPDQPKTPEPETPKPETPEPEKPKPENPEPENPEPENPEPENPEPENPEPEKPTPEPEETIKEKDAENLERIDENILEDIADDVGTGEVNVTPTPSEVVEAQQPTEQPTGDVFEGTAPEIVQNEASNQAEQIEVTNPENDYTEDLGGANADEYAPVEENTAAQEQADANEVSPEEAPSTVEEAQGTLGDLGIS